MDKRGLFGISTLAVIVAFVLGFFVGGYFVAKTEGWVDKVTGLVIGGKDKVEDLVVCPQDIKQCEDGSFVSRDSSNSCEFHECPEIIDTGSGNVGEIEEIEQSSSLDGENGEFNEINSSASGE